MRKLLLSVTASAFALSAGAQTASTFEGLTLPGSDTAYINFSAPGTDVGFTNGLAYFPCVYDTAGGFSSWVGGFAYSNETDTVTGDFLHEYHSRPGGGANGSSQYAVYFQPYFAGTVPRLRLTGSAAGKAVRSVWITNTTYAYNVMKNGDAFAGPAFGDTSAADTTHLRPDFLKLTIRGWLRDTLKSDSVDFYLADFRAANSANDYILDDWKYVSLLSLGKVDSLDFFLTSSRSNSFGNLIPAYFALDDLTTDETNTRVGTAPGLADVKVYPIPAREVLHIRAKTTDVLRVSVYSLAGSEVLVAEGPGGSSLDVAALPPGTYTLRMTAANGTTATTRFQKL